MHYEGMTNSSFRMVWDISFFLSMICYKTSYAFVVKGAMLMTLALDCKIDSRGLGHEFFN